jgi:membrane protein implicated in regulation of membrane protease activity
MLEWFQSAPSLDRTFALCAAVGAVLFVVRLGLQLTGLHDGDGFHLGGLASAGEADASFEFLSLHAINAFLLMFGLVGLAMRMESGAGPGWSILAATAAGGASMAIIGFLSLNLRKLQSSGNIEMSNAVGAVGEVYLTIPADGAGQVQVTFQHKQQIVDAISKSQTELKTGARVRVTGVTGASTLIVEAEETEADR